MRQRSEVFRMHSDSVQEFCSVALASHQQPIFDDYVARSGDYQGGAWMFGDARDLRGLKARMSNGWEEGAATLAELNAREIPPAQNTRRVRRWSDQGDTLDIHRVYAGRVDTAWQRTMRTNRRAPQNVRIIALIAGSCMQNAAQFFYRGAAVAKLSDLLSQAGYNVEIIGACVAEDVASSLDYCHTVSIKPPQSPLDLANLAAVLCQQGFVRYFMFRSFHALKDEKRIYNHMGTYGDRGLLDALAMESFAHEASPVTTLTMRYAIDSKAAAERWIDESLAAIEGRQREAVAA